MLYNSSSADCAVVRTAYGQHVMPANCQRNPTPSTLPSDRGWSAGQESCTDSRLNAPGYKSQRIWQTIRQLPCGSQK